MAARTRKELGDRGESAALEYLRSRGYDLIEQKHRQRSGEIDLLLRHGDTLVFCEVKTRRRANTAPESYSPRQQRRVRGLMLSYLAKTQWEGPLRVDLLALDGVPGSPNFRVHHFIDALALDNDFG